MPVLNISLVLLLQVVFGAAHVLATAPSPESYADQYIGLDSDTITVEGSAVCNGKSDDHLPLMLALDQLSARGGGTLQLPNRTCRLKNSLILGPRYSNIRIKGHGPGTVIDCDPTGEPYKPGINDACIQLQGTVSERRPILGPIAYGSLFFTAKDVSDTSDLRIGDWVIIEEYDDSIGANHNPVVYDWYQVSEVRGTRVGLYYPTRIVFPNSRGSFAVSNGLGFRRVVRPLVGFSIEDVKLVVRPAWDKIGRPALYYAFGNMNGHVRDVWVDNARGNGIATDGVKGFEISGFHQEAARFQATEIAETVDFNIHDSQFLNDMTTVASSIAPDTSAFTIDVGSGWGSVHDNTIQGGSIAVRLYVGVHDVDLSNNRIGWLAPNLGISNGIECSGCQNVKLLFNNLDGGLNIGSKGIYFSDSSAYIVDINSKNNLALFNTVKGFSHPYSLTGSLRSDILVTQSEDVTRFEGALKSNGPISAGSGTGISDTSKLVQFVGTVSTSDSTADTLIIPGLPRGSHCYAVAANEKAATLGGIYVTPLESSGAVVLDHPRTAGAQFSIFCSFE